MYEFFDFLSSYFDKITDVIKAPLFELGSSDVSVGTIFYFIGAFLVLNFIATRTKKLLVDKVLARANFEIGLRSSIGNIIKFSILVIGTVVIIQSAGIDLSALSLLAGALGVGIGFGLQNITDNFISGLIILFEKPIKVGDRIEVGEINGDVLTISVRATTVLTNDNISIIVPNSEFISQKVINWSHNDRNIRFRFPVGVSYKEDPRKVEQILLKVANENPNVLKKPEPNVFFDKFGDSSLDFTIAVWTDSYIDRPGQLKSQLYFEIFKQFAENGIEIPFPQRDIHIKTPDSSTKLLED